MTDTSLDTSQDPALDELGPVDYAVVEFPAGHSNFTGEAQHPRRNLGRTRDSCVKDDHVLQARAATGRDGEPHNALVIAHHRTHQRVVATSDGG